MRYFKYKSASEAQRDHQLNKIWGTLQTDVLHGDDDGNFISAGARDDWVYGGGGDDIIYGHDHNDTLYGGAGDDLLEGSWGDDILSGDDGDDVLIGGRGKDTFVYREKAFGHDLVVDFRSGEDKLDLRGSGLTWSDLKISTAGGKTVVDAGGGNKITLDGTTVGTSDFLFGTAPAEKAPPEDLRPTVSIKALETSVDEGDTATFRVSLSKAYEKDVQFRIQITDSETEGVWETDEDIDNPHPWDPWSEYIKIEAGQTSIDIDVPVIQDDLYEGDEHIEASLTATWNGLIGQRDATVTIVDDDDPPEVSIGDVALTEDGKLRVAVEISKNLDRKVVVDWSSSDGQTGSVYFVEYPQFNFETWRMEEITRKTIEVDIPEGWSDETFTVTLSNPRGATLGSASTATVMITDDEGLPAVELEDGDPQPLDVGDVDENTMAPRTATKGTMAAETLSGVAGMDAIECLGGDDFAEGLGGDDCIWGNLGADTLYGNGGDDCLWGGRGKDTLIGGLGDDRLFGGQDADALHGGKGRDKLWGGGGDDVLHGGEDRDRLEGGLGNDTLTGGDGADRFVFCGDTFGRDRITDFEDGKDMLKFHGVQWSDLAIGSNARLNFESMHESTRCFSG